MLIEGTYKIHEENGVKTNFTNFFSSLCVFQYRIIVILYDDAARAERVENPFTAISSSVELDIDMSSNIYTYTTYSYTYSHIVKKFKVSSIPRINMLIKFIIIW